MIDYFSWGRDKRLMIENNDVMQKIGGTLSKRLTIKRLMIFFVKRLPINFWVYLMSKKYFGNFGETQELMSDKYSRTLFAEILLQKIIGEKNFKLRSFSRTFIESYEGCVKLFLKSNEEAIFEGWQLKKMKYKDLTVFSIPSLFNCMISNRLYEYKCSNVHILIEPGDVVIDAGIGWGDTTVFFSWLTGNIPGSKVIAIDIQKESLRLLDIQRRNNPTLKNITSFQNALSSKDGSNFNIENNGPGSKVMPSEANNNTNTVESISIDTIVKKNKLKKLNFIKMDIEGSEVEAILGGRESIQKFKPKLAISAYHKIDDLYTIPKLIHSIRSDYKFYLDCTTGFGGETILYCQ